ncbi:hypothetical protein GURKE_02270 [Brevundimonas phage vB_BpoS-Gurke]|uniref:Uncharacterized protein n=1 Tax=Brevundimonas phage vB_BpoS-Gurke TaxID=2948599 RepID=A0A9E7N3P1_9CAUD|nr:hypothetical protein GURKE_02270 [Brevundimonas phage vB_BpoS-Gurke]
MNERLNVYHYRKTDPALRAVSPNGKQASCYVAAASQKEACELLGITPNDMRNYGGITRNDALIAAFKTEPRVVFVEKSHGVYVRWPDLGTDREFLVNVRDEDLHGREIDHPSFGMITLSRFSGHSDLFMVDYPQGHAIALEIDTARLLKHDTRENVYTARQIIRIEMSEVQFARLMSSPNTGGVLCTLVRYRDPLTGDYLTPRPPERHINDDDTYREAISKRAAKASEKVSQARKTLEEMLEGKTVRKGDLADALEALKTAEREFNANLPYVAEAAHEAISTMSENAKSEIDAHIDVAMQRLGERALGSRLDAMLESGVDTRSVGQAVLQALNPPKPQVEPEPQDEG